MPWNITQMQQMSTGNFSETTTVSKDSYISQEHRNQKSLTSFLAFAARRRGKQRLAPNSWIPMARRVGFRIQSLWRSTDL
mmetsp:Transcript_26664/g.73347  ORF Transcript_26664/g.73347 Transcript_26664/m.73347 type:complete len:80 (-) Transcript_26664:8818-9057(-)